MTAAVSGLVLLHNPKPPWADSDNIDSFLFEGSYKHMKIGQRNRETEKEETRERTKKKEKCSTLVSSVEWIHLFRLNADTLSGAALCRHQ